MVVSTLGFVRFAGLEVRGNKVFGDGNVLELYDATALVGPVAGFPRQVRTALSPRTAFKDDRPQLVVSTPYGGLLRRSLTPGSEAEARTFAALLNAASAECRRL